MPSDISYFNPESIKPNYDWKPQGFLAGMHYAQDRTRYDSQASLQDLMTGAKAGEWFKDAPVRESARYKDINTNMAEGSTVLGRKQGELEKLGLENQYSRGTLQARIAEKVTEEARKKHEFGLQKINDGLNVTSMLLQALGSAGPAGVAAAKQKLKEAGYDADNDPVVSQLMAGGSPEQIALRVQQVQQALNMANQQFRTEQMKDAGATRRNTDDNTARVSVANAKTGHEKVYEQAVRIYGNLVRQQNPNWTNEQVQAEALRLYQERTSGVGKTEGAEEKALSAALAKALEIRKFIPNSSPLAKQIDKEIEELQQKLRREGGGVPNRPQGRGTPDDPIRLTPRSAPQSSGGASRPQPQTQWTEPTMEQVPQQDRAAYNQVLAAARQGRTSSAMGPSPAPTAPLPKPPASFQQQPTKPAASGKWREDLEAVDPQLRALRVSAQSRDPNISSNAWIAYLRRVQELDQNQGF